MSARRFRSTAPGQAIPLIALLIVVLIAMVGLSVDVGNTYAQQRNTVRATNASALAGMNALIQNGSDQAIGQVIQQSLGSNGISAVFGDSETSIADNQRLVQAYYMDAKGNHMASCNVGSCGSVPTGVSYIEVDVEGAVTTYFARVVNRPTLPVSSKAFAGRCTPVSGVYPIAIQSSNLDSTGTKLAIPSPTTSNDYYGTYRDATYTTALSERRIFVKDSGAGPGSASFLRWRAATANGSSSGLATSLTGDGDLEAGFDEGLVNGSGGATWPDSNSQAPTVNGTVVYPIKPHEINTGDWAYANTGTAWSSLQTALKYHIDNKTVMIMPIVDPSVGSNTTQAYPIKGLGQFILRGIPGYGNAASVSAPAAAGNFLDLAYIGPVNAVACLSTPAVVDNTLGITGAVFVRPSWGQEQPVTPIAYEIIMDVSGSMSWNFKGQGYANGSIQQCEATQANPTVTACGGGYNNPWPTVSERRIYVLKNAIAGTGGFIENMKATDTMRVIAFSSTGISSASAWTSDQTTLKNTVMNAGNYNNSSSNQYLTEGGTNGPQAIQKASQILSSSPPPASSTGKAYKPVVIYFTDGVANIFINGTTNYGYDVCPSYSGTTKGLNDVWCQYDKVGYPKATGNMRRPISEMIYQAGIMKAANPNMQFFTVGLANTNPLGLDEVASSPSLLYLAQDATLVPTVLDQIYDRVIGPCTEVSTDWIGRIDAAHTASAPMPALPSGVYGYVYLANDLGQPVPVSWSGSGSDPRASNQQNAIPVTADSAGNLTYSVPSSNGLAPGNYHLSGYVNYKAANQAPTAGADGVSRQYSSLVENSVRVSYATFNLNPSELLGSTKVVDPMHLAIAPTVNLCR